MHVKIYSRCCPLASVDVATVTGDFSVTVTMYEAPFTASTFDLTEPLISLTDVSVIAVCTWPASAVGTVMV